MPDMSVPCWPDKWKEPAFAITPHYSSFVVITWHLALDLVIVLTKHVLWNRLTETVSKDHSIADLTWHAQQSWERCVTACLTDRQNKPLQILLPDYVPAFWTDSNLMQHKFIVMAEQCPLSNLTPSFTFALESFTGNLQCASHADTQTGKTWQIRWEHCYSLTGCVGAGEEHAVRARNQGNLLCTWQQMMKNDVSECVIP